MPDNRMGTPGKAQITINSKYTRTILFLVIGIQGAYNPVGRVGKRQHNNRRYVRASDQGLRISQVSTGPKGFSCQPGLERGSGLFPGHLRGRGKGSLQPIPSDGCYRISMLGTLDAQRPGSQETQHHSNHTRKLGQPEKLKERRWGEVEGRGAGPVRLILDNHGLLCRASMA